jgi:hypothetical protein
VATLDTTQVMKMAAYTDSFGPSTGFRDISGSELSDPKVRNPICQFSTCSQMIQTVPELGFEPLTSLRAQSDALAFSAMDPGHFW